VVFEAVVKAMGALLVSNVDGGAVFGLINGLWKVNNTNIPSTERCARLEGRDDTLLVELRDGACLLSERMT